MDSSTKRNISLGATGSMGLAALGFNSLAKDTAKINKRIARKIGYATKTTAGLAAAGALGAAYFHGKNRS